MRKFLALTLASVISLSYMVAAFADEVNIYSARQENLIKPILDRFTDQTGIQVNLITGGADELITRIAREGANSPADILLTVDVGRLYRAKEQGVLRSISSDLLEKRIPEHYRDSDNQWYAMSLRSRVIVYHKDRVDPAQLSTYEALAEPRWSGRICIRSSSNIYNQSLVASMISHHGVAETESWVRGLVANMARSPQGGDRDQVSAIVAGQCDVAVINTYYLAGMLDSTAGDERQTAEQVNLFWPNQSDRGAHINISGAGVTEHAPNPEAAVRLLEFLVSDESQSWYADVNNEFPVRDGIPVSDTLRNWGSFKADSIALEELGIHNAEAVRLMDRAGWR
ncbi:MAG: Fe(3+) ABC transporter substrate-binding protein [Pseudohongiellaceae bacterium]